MNPTMNDVAQNIERTADEMTRPEGKPISTRLHGVFDYSLSPTLAVMPQAFGFPSEGAGTIVPRVYGAASMVYSALTRYEMGVYPVIPMKTHLLIDAVSSAFMAVSPWVFGFGKSKRKRSWLPYLTFAAAEALIVALTDPRSKR